MFEEGSGGRLDHHARAPGIFTRREKVMHLGYFDEFKALDAFFITDIEISVAPGYMINRPKSQTS